MRVAVEAEAHEQLRGGPLELGGLQPHLQPKRHQLAHLHDAAHGHQEPHKVPEGGEGWVLEVWSVSLESLNWKHADKNDRERGQWAIK